MADSLRTVIGTTLVIGGALVAILVLRESRFAPEWLRPPAEEPSAVPATATTTPPATPTATSTGTATVAATATATSTTAESAADAASSIASAPPEPSASAAPPVASARTGKGGRQGPAAAAQPGEPEVVELPNDYRYSPQGPGNLTFPVAPATASTATGR